MAEDSKKRPLIRYFSGIDDHPFVLTIDDWIKEGQSANDPLFATRRARDGFLFNHKNVARKKWRTSGRCMFPVCSHASIPRSHAISRAGPLSIVAERGHVVTPRVFNFDDLRFVEMGIGDAATFPGFCRIHEEEFSEFEAQKDLTNKRDWLLQFFRTVCWEVRILEYARDRLKRLLVSTEKLLRDSAARYMLDELGIEVNVTSVNGIDWRQSIMEGEIARLENLIAEYERDFLGPLRSIVIGGDADLCVLAAESPFQIPVCLAGRGNFHVATIEGPATVVVFLLVLPTVRGTKLALLSRAADEEAVHLYVDLFTTAPLDFVRMVESWMLHGTDHWFLRPSVWHGLSHERQQLLIEEFKDYSLSIGQPSKVSIFEG